MSLLDRSTVFAELRSRLAGPGRAIPLRAQLSSGIAELDRALGGGIPRNGLTLIEGSAGCGRSWPAAAFLRTATHEGFAALIELPDHTGYLAPPALEACGVQLDRLVCLHLKNDLAVLRAAEWLVRSGSLRLLVLPAVAVRPRLWQRLAHTVLDASAGIVVVGTGNPELRAAATVRIGVELREVRWGGHCGPLGYLAGASFAVNILKSRTKITTQELIIDTPAFSQFAPQAQAQLHTHRFFSARMGTGSADSLHTYLAG